MLSHREALSIAKCPAWSVLAGLLLPKVGPNMANSILFLVVVLRQIGDREYQVDAAIRVSSAERARSVAAQLAEWQGTVAFCIIGDSSKGQRENPEILARFGYVPDDCALRDELRSYLQLNAQG
jgi:hypothetical protein